MSSKVPPTCTVAAFATSGDARAAGPSATSPAITSLVDDGWINRSVPSDALQGKIVAAIANREGLAVIDVIDINNGFRRIDTDPFLDGTQSIPAPGAISVAGYLRQ